MALAKEVLGEILFSEEVIAAKVKELAQQVSADYQGLEIHLVTVLKGALVFLADFSRELAIGATLDFMVVSSYYEMRERASRLQAGSRANEEQAFSEKTRHDAFKSSGEVRILKDLDF